MAKTLNNIGTYSMKIQQYDDALIHLKQSLEVCKNISFNQQKDDNMAMTLNSIGICWMKMLQYDDALIALKQSFDSNV